MRRSASVHCTAHKNSFLESSGKKTNRGHGIAQLDKMAQPPMSINVMCVRE